MKRHHAAISIPALALFAVGGVAAFPATGAAADDAQAEREARRIEGEARRQQEQGRRAMEERERAQAEAVRGQEEAIRRMEATRARIEANTQQLAQQSADQARDLNYSYNTARAPLLYSYPDNTSNLPPPPVLSPVVPEVRSYVYQWRDDDPVSGMSFAPLSERLGSYFGARAGVLVVGAGPGAPFGLQDGDVILSVDGRLPADGQHAAAILRSYRPGEHVKLQVQRDGRAINLDVTAPGQRGN